MNSNLTFDFSIDKKNKTIIIKREFDADLPMVWNAYTKSEILDQWWAPKPWKARTKSMEFREGGQWLYAMEGPNGEEQWSVATYQKIEFQKRFIERDGFSDEKGNINKEMPQSKWEVIFTDEGQKTLVEYHISFDDLSQMEGLIKMGFKEGITMGMENLDGLLVPTT